MDGSTRTGPAPKAKRDSSGEPGVKRNQERAAEGSTAIDARKARYRTSAMIRTGPRELPPIFMGATMTTPFISGARSRLATFSKG